MLHECLSKGRCLLLEYSKQFQPGSKKELPNCQQLGLAVFGESLTLGDAIDQCIAAKRAANLRSRYTDSLANYLHQYSKGREQTELSSVTTADVEKWMANYPCAATRQSWLNRLSSLFSWAVRRGHISANPTVRIERVRVDRCPPRILTTEEAEMLIKIVPSISLPYLILGLYAGIRPEEITRLDWKAIDLKTGTVAVDGKTRRRRIVTLEPKALALLKGCPLQTGNVAPSASTLRRFK